MENAADIEQTDGDGFTALIRSAQSEHDELVRLLIDRDAHVNANSSNGSTALFWATARGHADTVRLLLERGADIDQTTQNGATALVAAAQEGHLAVVQLLLDNKADTEKVYNSGSRALAIAAEAGHADVIEALLQGGAVVDAVSSQDGSTALLIAAIFGQLDAVQTLLKHGASIDLPDADGSTPLMMAAGSKHSEVLKFLLESGASVKRTAPDEETPLRFAASTGDTQCIQLLLDHEAGVNETGYNNCSALQNAVFYGHTEAFKLLLSSGAEISIKDNDGDTILHETALAGQTDYCWRKTLTASQRGHVDVATLLLGQGADANMQTRDNRTALMLACDGGHAEIVRLLLDSGAHVNVADSEEMNSLMRASCKGHEEIVRLLLDSGAFLALTDSCGRTAAEFARLNCRYTIRSILCEYETSQLHAQTPVTDVVSTRRKPDWYIPSREVRKEQQPFLVGSFGKVYRGWWLSTRVVVKTVTVATDRESRTFHREARIWQKARHPNIVPFFGACDEGSTYFFVCEEAKNGKLVDYLYRARQEGRSLVWRKLLDAALGLHFLHERHVVHSDLKCNQILVSKDGVAMLTDFGLSFLASETSGDEETVGAIRWKAPEVIRKEKPVAPNAQSDVYSFGMCVVEAVTSDVPWGQVPDPVVKFHVTRKKSLPRPKAFESDAQWDLVQRLCAFEPSERMKLSDAIEVIRGFAEEERFQERLREMTDDVGDLKGSPDLCACADED